MTTVASLNAAALLDAWERGRTAPPPWRGAALLCAALPEATPDAVAALTPGERDRHLLALRTSVFGAAAELVADCPACGIQVQFRGTLDPPEAAAGPEPAVPTVDGHRVTVRPLTLLDLADAAASGEPTAARRLLLERAVVRAENDAGPVPIDAFPDRVVAAVEAVLAAADPPPVPELNLACPDCGVRWSGVLDVEAFLWEELEAWARRTVQEVDALARAYGWREADILALSPWRRNAYLDMVSKG